MADKPSASSEALVEYSRCAQRLAMSAAAISRARANIRETLETLERVVDEVGEDPLELLPQARRMAAVKGAPPPAANGRVRRAPTRRWAAEIRAELAERGTEGATIREVVEAIGGGILAVGSSVRSLHRDGGLASTGYGQERRWYLPEHAPSQEPVDG